MSETSTMHERQRPVSSRILTCRLRLKKKTGRRGPVHHLAEVELENGSTSPVEITYRMTVFQYLNLVVANADGSIVSEGHFGDRFAPTLESQTLRLEPGEKFAADVHLFATVRQNPLPSGVYTAQAIYEYDGWRVVSQPVEISV